MHSHTLFFDRGRYFTLDVRRNGELSAYVSGGNQPDLASIGFVPSRIPRWFETMPTDIAAVYHDTSKHWVIYETDWRCPQQSYEPTAQCVYYPTIKYCGIEVINDGWAWNSKSGTVLRIYASAGCMPIKRRLDRLISEGHHPQSLTSRELTGWEDEWRKYLQRLLEKGFRPLADKYETTPLAATGELPISELELVEGPPPFPVAGVDPI